MLHRGGPFVRATQAPSYTTIEARLSEVTGQVIIRSGSNPGGDRVYASREDWQAFVAAVKAGQFDYPADSDDDDGSEAGPF